MIPEWQKLNVEGHRLGSVNAPVQIIEFFDYECPYCKEVEPSIQSIREKYPKNDVSIVYTHFPLNEIHEYAYAAALAVECAAQQNQFEAFHSLLFSHQDQLGSVSFDSLAVVAGVKDLTSFNRCLQTEETSSIIQSGIDMAEKLNIDGTPTFLISGRLVSGALSSQQLDNFVKEALSE